MSQEVQGACHGEVHVEYHRLEPGTFVRFTPETPAFQKELEERQIDLEALLQRTLMRHTALSEGDWIEVEVPPVATEAPDRGAGGDASVAPAHLDAGAETHFHRLQVRPRQAQF